jgi:dTDP-glucose 4,6-dehydratase
MHFNLNNFEITKISDLKNSEILVTGGTGFLGRWILEFVIYLNDKYNFNIKLYLLARKITLELNQILNTRSDVFFIQNDIIYIFW